MTTTHRLTEAMRGIRRKFSSARIHIALTRQMFRHKSPRQVARRLIQLVRDHGPRGVYQHWRTLTVHRQVAQHTDRALRASTQTLIEPKHRYTPLASIDMDRYDYLFLDVFDTAVIRLVCRPVDLFQYVAIRHGLKGFQQERIAKEAQARADHPDQKDIHLQDIYRLLPQAGMQAEIDAELQFCIANPEIRALYDTWIRAGKKVCFVSDMYLDQATVTAILHANGYTTYEAVHVSSQDDLIKGDGSRFARLRAQIPDSAGRTLHLGDNRISDFVQPIAYGFDAIHTMEVPDYFLGDSFIRSKMPLLEARHSLGTSFILASFRYWKSSQTGTTPDYWQQFGFLYGGALITAFCEFIHDSALKNNPSTKKIFFLARDGHILSQVFRLLYDDIEAVYLFASRRCMILPVLTGFNYETDGNFLRQFTNTLGISHHSDIITRFSYGDLTGLAADLEKTCPEAQTLTEQNIYACIQKNRHEIENKVLAERDTLLSYLEHVGFLEENRISIADVGWGGSIQDALVALLKISNHKDKTIHGYYLGVNSNVAHARHKSGLLFDGDQSDFLEYINLMELLTAAPEDGIIRIRHEDGEYLPVRQNPCDKEEKRKIAAQGIQKGVLDFARLAKQRRLRVRDLVGSEDFRNLFLALQTSGSEDDISQLEQLRHPSAIGGNYAHRVLAGKSNADFS
ncbi:MAG: hypothetical protein WCY98_02605 [Castellaniella sp.]